MEGFKSFKKIQCFKEGGSVKYESRKEHKEEMAADVAQDKKIVKKAFKMHDEQEHKGEHTNLSKLKKGGRAKKAVGTVKKYKVGGAVLNTGSSDVTKDGGKKTGGADIKTGKKTGNVDILTGKKTGRSDAAKDGGKTGGVNDAYKCGGKVKKYADGGIADNVMGTPEQNAAASRREAAYLKSKLAQQAAGIPMSMGEKMAMGLSKMGQKLQPAAQAAPAGSTIPAGQKKGGKVCR